MSKKYFHLFCFILTILCARNSVEAKSIEKCVDQESSNPCDEVCGSKKVVEWGWKIDDEVTEGTKVKCSSMTQKKVACVCIK